MSDPNTVPLYKIIFQNKISEDPDKYYEGANKPVGIAPDDINDQIEEYGYHISDDPINSSTEDVVRTAWINGIPLISIKYRPDQTRYQLIESILSKLDRCSRVWNMGTTVEETRIKDIYDLMTSDCPIDQIIEKFTTEELRTYGW